MDSLTMPPFTPIWAPYLFLLDDRIGSSEREVHTEPMMELMLLLPHCYWHLLKVPNHPPVILQDGFSWPSSEEDPGCSCSRYSESWRNMTPIGCLPDLQSPSSKISWRYKQVVAEHREWQCWRYNEVTSAYGHQSKVDS